MFQLFVNQTLLIKKNRILFPATTTENALYVFVGIRHICDYLFQINTLFQNFKGHDFSTIVTEHPDLLRFACLCFSHKVIDPVRIPWTFHKNSIYHRHQF